MERPSNVVLMYVCEYMKLYQLYFELNDSKCNHIYDYSY